MIDAVHLASDNCRNSDDVKILGLAIAASADYIVTADNDLLLLKRFKGIPILNPREFSNLLHSQEE
jgi:predicted nucleic acid-binding protein